MELQYFDRHSSTTRKRNSHRKKSLVFSPGSFLKLYFKNGKTWSSMTTIRTFLPKIMAPFYNFWKRAVETLLSYAPESSRIMLKDKSSNIFYRTLRAFLSLSNLHVPLWLPKIFKLIMSKKQGNRFAS